jgi:hypothetical protein
MLQTRKRASNVCIKHHTHVSPLRVFSHVCRCLTDHKAFHKYLKTEFLPQRTLLCFYAFMALYLRGPFFWDVAPRRARRFERAWLSQSLISGFSGDVDEIWALLGYYAASCGNCLPTFWDNVSVPSSRVKSPSRKERNTCVFIFSSSNLFIFLIFTIGLFVFYLFSLIFIVSSLTVTIFHIRFFQLS